MIGAKIMSGGVLSLECSTYKYLTEPGSVNGGDPPWLTVTETINERIEIVRDGSGTEYRAVKLNKRVWLYPRHVGRKQKRIPGQRNMFGAIPEDQGDVFK